MKEQGWHVDIEYGQSHFKPIAQCPSKYIQKTNKIKTNVTCVSLDEGGEVRALVDCWGVLIEEDKMMLIIVWKQ